MADGTMISREVGKPPKGEKEFRVWLEKVLRDHYQDIQSLFSMCTDCDRFEKLQRDNTAV